MIYNSLYDLDCFYTKRSRLTTIQQMNFDKENTSFLIHGIYQVIDITDSTMYVYEESYYYYNSLMYKSDFYDLNQRVIPKFIKYNMILNKLFLSLNRYDFVNMELKGIYDSTNDCFNFEIHKFIKILTHKEYLQLTESAYKK